MATEKTDVVIVGVGAAGGILAAELGKAGMKVIGLERGPRLKTAGLRAARRVALFPAPGSAARTSSAMPVTWRPNANARAHPMPSAEQRQPGRRRHRALRLGVVALARGRFPRALADHRALRRVGDPGRLLADRLAAELCRSRAVSTTAPNTSSACRARPATCRARRSTAATCSRRRASANIRCRRCWSISRRSCSRPAPRSSACIRSRRRARSSRSPTRTGRAAPIAASARRSAATSAPNRRSWSPSCPEADATGNFKLITGAMCYRVNSDNSGKATGVSYYGPGPLRQHDRGRHRHPRAVHLRQYAAAAVVEDRQIPERARQFERPSRQAHHGAYRRRACSSRSTTATSTSTWARARRSTRIDDFNADNFDHKDLGFIRGAQISVGPAEPRRRPDRHRDEHEPAARRAALGRGVSRLLRQVLHAATAP